MLEYPQTSGSQYVNPKGQWVEYIAALSVEECAERHI